MIDDPLGNKTLASIDSDYFRSLLPKTVAGRDALGAAASEIEREIANIEAQQKKLLQSSIQPSRAMTRALKPRADGSDPLAYLTNGSAGTAGPWDGVRQAVSGYDNLAFSEQQRLYDEFVKQEAARTGKNELDIRMATKDSAPIAPQRQGGDIVVDVLAGLGAGVTGMGSTVTDLVAPDSGASKALHERVAVLNAMQSPVEQNARKEVAAELARFKQENPDAGALKTFGEEALATVKNLTPGTVANLAGSLAVSGGAAGKVAKAVAAARVAGGATAAEAALAARLAGTATGSGIAGASTGGEVRGDFYQQVMALPVSDPNLQNNEDFQKYLVEERGDVDPNAPNRSPIAERAAQLRARERLALDSKGAATVAGLISAGLAGFGPEAVISKAAAHRAAAEATGDTVGAATRVLGKLDNVVGRLPVTVAAEGVDEGLPTVATNVNFQQVDPTRGALAGAGGDVVLGMLGGAGGHVVGAVEDRAAQQSPQAAIPAAVAPPVNATPTPNERITVTETPEGPAYSVRNFDNSVVEIPAGPEAQQQASELAQQADQESASLDQTPSDQPTTVELFGTTVTMLPNGTIEYAPGATPTAEADQFITQQNAALAPAAASLPLDQPTSENLPAAVPSEQIQQHATEILNDITSDPRLTEHPITVLQHAADGAFSPELELLLQDLSDANWLGYATPKEAVDAALSSDLTGEVLPSNVADAVNALRSTVQTDARMLARSTQEDLPSGTAPGGVAVTQQPAAPVAELSVDDQAAIALANNTRDLARNPLPDIAAIGGDPTPEQRVAFFDKTLAELLAPYGGSVAPRDSGTKAQINVPGGSSYTSLETEEGGQLPQIAIGTGALQDGSGVGGALYNAINAAAVAAGLPLHNGGLSTANQARLPINRMKALLQTTGASDVPLGRVAELLALNPDRIGNYDVNEINDFNSFARTVIEQAERHFPTAEANNMRFRRRASNYLEGVLRLNPDGTFDTPAGTMTPAQLKQWTRTNVDGLPRYEPTSGGSPATATAPAVPAVGESTAFGASSYSSMALAAMLRSYMEATTPAQREAVIEGAKKVSATQESVTDGNVRRPYAFLDVRRNGSANISSPGQVRALSALKRSLSQWQAGKITADQHVGNTARLVTSLESRQAERRLKDSMTERERGVRIVRQRLDEAARRGTISEETADFALWLLQQNPALATDLSVSIKPTKDGAGQYLPLPRIIQLFSNPQDGTAVHEILHHTERMMPEAVRSGIRKSYEVALKKAMKNATPAQQIGLTQLVTAAAQGQGAEVQKLFDDGTLNYDEHYQFANPSEFWAVNATTLLEKRRGEGQVNWKVKAKKWLSGLAQKMKALLGLPNNNAVLQGIEAVLRADGSYQANTMLAEAERKRVSPAYLDIPPSGPTATGASGDQSAPRNRAGFDQLLQSTETRTTLPAASPERALIQAIDPKQITEPGQVRRAIDQRVQQLNEAFHDHLAPVERLFSNIGDSSPELQNLGESAIGAMRMAPGVRDEIMRQMIDDHGGKALFSTIEEIARTQGMTTEDAIGYVGYWLTAQRAPTANARLIARDTREVERLSRLHAQAEQALVDARNTAGTPADTLARLERELVDVSGQLQQATKQLTNRTLAVNNPKSTGVTRHVAGVAGFNNAQAAALAESIEKHIPKEMLQKAADSVYDLNAFRLVTDLESGRASPETVAAFLDKPDITPLLQELVGASQPDAQQEQSQAERDALREQVMAAVRSDYVPLTGDPQTALYDESPAGGASQPNTGRTYSMEGRQDSMPDDGLSATLAGLIRSASHAGWAPFQDAVAQVYEKMTPAQRDEFGIHRETRDVTDRTTGTQHSALVRLRDGVEQRFTFKDPKILQAIHNETIADTDAALGGIAKLTRLYAWAATQFNLPFAPRNMVRDFGERADTLLSKELRDEQGNKVPSPQVLKTMLYYGTKGLPGVLNAGVRFALNGTAGGKSKESRYLRELQESGGLSTFGARFQNSRRDFIKQINSAKSSSKRLKALSHYTVELWNRPFDFAAPLASYIAMRENGVAKDQAQAIALDLMNFRKRGTQMKTVSAVLPFAQTGVTGGVNMARSLMDLRKGKIRPYAVARMTGYVLALSALRAMFMAAADDDEGGNKLAQLPDYEHENNILIPYDDGVVKVPLPFGLIRLANGIVNNTLSYAGHEKTGGEAVGDMMMGTIIPSFTPISESPLDGDKYPIQKLIMTLAPPIVKPIVQAATGLTAFGAPLKNEYAKKDKFISDQPKLNTPQAYTTMAQAIRQWTGADVPPEVVREIVKGYPLGVLNYARAGLLENKAIADELRKPFFSPYPEAARYFQFKKAFDDASTELKKAERGDTDYDPAKIAWLKNYEKQENAVQGKISSITKRKGLSDAAKEEQKTQLRADRSSAQNAALYKWRTEILKAEAKETGQ